MAFKRTKFRALNVAKVNERATRTGNKFDSMFINGVTPYRLKQGSNFFRLVRDADSDYWAHKIWVHSYVGTKNSTYLCPKKMSKGDRDLCPICDAYADAVKEGDKDEAKAFEPKERAIAYIIDREDEKAGLKVFDMSWSMDRDIAAACRNSRTGEVVDVTDPDQGFDISVTRTGSKLATRYIGMQVDRDSTPLAESQKQQDKLMEQVQSQPLPSLLKFRDAAYLADILTGKVEEKDEEEEVKPASKRRGVIDEPEEDGEQEDDRRTTRRGRGDEGDGEEERPSRSRGRGRTSAEPVDDEQEDDRRTTRPARTRAPVEPDEEEDDQDPLPPQRTARRGSKPAPEEDEDEPAPPTRSRKARGPAADPDEDDNDETAEAARWRKQEAKAGRRGAEPDEDPDDEDDVLPAKRPTRKRLEEDAPPPRRGKAVPPPDDEEDEEEDDEGDAPPPRRARR